MENKDITNLLNQVTQISKKYEHIAAVTGENYNVFNVLGIGNDELSHSAILANLLNAKGSHGQKDIFLKLFFDTLKESFQDQNFNENEVYDLTKFNTIDFIETLKSTAIKEKFAGKKDLENSEGGRIDILLTDGVNKIIIENKIYAVDQEQQLVRYKNYDVNAPIFYLNLFGENPSAGSTKELAKNKDYYIISYQTEICSWLEKCIEKMANKPIIRETLNQYLNLVKRNTNQSNNRIMSNEITNIILKEENFDAFVKIAKSTHEVKIEMVSSIAEKLKKIIESNGFTVVKIVKPSIKYKGVLVEFTNKILEKSNLSLRLNFEKNDYTNLIFGLYKIDLKNEIADSNLVLKFSDFFNTKNKSNKYPAYFIYEKFKDWYLINLKELYYTNNFYDDFEKILDMIKKEVLS